MRLCDITNKSIRRYQQRRPDGLSPFKHQRHPDHLNEEIAKLRQILNRANLWHLLADNDGELDSPLGELMWKADASHGMWFRHADSQHRKPAV